MPPYHVMVIDPLPTRLNTIEVNMRAFSVRHINNVRHFVSLFSAFVKQLVEDLDLFDLECKLGMFRVRFSLHRASVSGFVRVTCKNNAQGTLHCETL